MGKHDKFCIKLWRLARWWLWIWNHFWAALFVAFVVTLALQVIYTLANDGVGEFFN